MRVGSDARAQTSAMTVFVLVLLASVGLVAHLLSTFFTAIVLALVLVALSAPIERWIRAHVAQPIVSSALTTAAIVLLVLLPLAGFGAALVQETLTLLNSARDGAITAQLQDLIQGQGVLAEDVRLFVGRFGFDITPDEIASVIEETVRSALAAISSGLTSVASDTVTLVVHFAIMVVVLFSLYLDGGRIKRFLFDLSPLPDDEEEMLVRRFTELARAVFLGNGVASGLQGVLGGLAIVLFDIGPGILWGTVIAILAFLPILGATLVFLPAAIFLALKSGIGVAFAYVVFNVLYVTVLEYGLKPRLIGGQASLPSALVFLGIVAGLAQYGVMGIFLGPLVMTVFLTLVELWRARYRRTLFPETTPPSPAP